MNLIGPNTSNKQIGILILLKALFLLSSLSLHAMEMAEESKAQIKEVDVNLTYDEYQLLIDLGILDNDEQKFVFEADPTNISAYTAFIFKNVKSLKNSHKELSERLKGIFEDNRKYTENNIHFNFRLSSVLPNQPILQEEGSASNPIDLAEAQTVPVEEEIEALIELTTEEAKIIVNAGESLPIELSFNPEHKAGSYLQTNYILNLPVNTNHQVELKNKINNEISAKVNEYEGKKVKFIIKGPSNLAVTADSEDLDADASISSFSKLTEFKNDFVEGLESKDKFIEFAKKHRDYGVYALIATVTSGIIYKFFRSNGKDAAEKDEDQEEEEQEQEDEDCSKKEEVDLQEQEGDYFEFSAPEEIPSLSMN